MGAERELAILVTAKDLASRTIGKVSREVGGLGKISKTVGHGLSSLAGNLAKVGAVAAVGIGAAVKGGLDSLATLENATTAVDGAIKQMGLTGQVTSGQVAQWANEIESNVEAAFDDKDIVRATATLLRFGKVTPSNLKPAMQVITDLATKTGSVDSAASLLGKALADPEKAAGKLAKSGFVLTKVQQEEIKAFVKAGQTAKAQDYILDQLSKTTKNAARDSVGPYGDALNTLSDAAEDAKRALAEGFLPVIQRAATWLKTKLADPKVIEDIRGFGKGLAGAFDKALTFAQEIPWDSVRSAMQMAGEGAKAALGFFQGMPPWVQTAVLSGWGLNKLTGGAVGSLVGQLGSGLIKGVLGMNAGVVNVNAGVVNGAGGLGGGMISKGGGTGIFKTVGGALKVAGAMTIAAVSIELLAQTFDDFLGKRDQAQKELQEQVDKTNRQGFAQTVANLRATAEGIDKLSLIDKITAATFSGGQISQDFVAGAGRLLAQARTQDELLASKTAIEQALATAKYIGLDKAVGPLRAELLAINLKLAKVLPSAAPIVKLPALPGSRDAAGVAQRAMEHGKIPSISDITHTLDRNAARAAENTRKLAVAQAISSRAQQLLMAVTNANLATIAGKDFAPQITVPVHVTSIVSVRDVSVAQRTIARYGNSNRIYEP